MELNNFACVGVVVDNAVSAKSLTTWTNVFCENKRLCETVFACLYGAQVELFDKKSVENLVTLSL